MKKTIYEIIFIILVWMGYMALIMVIVNLNWGCSIHPWTKQDTIREIAVLSLMAVDWRQTKYIADNPERFDEHNILLGSHPNPGKVDLYFAGMGLTHILVSRFLPPQYREMFQYISIGGWSVQTYGNYQNGVKIK